MLVVDGIQNVTIANGLVRIQVVQTGSDGKSKEVEEIAIPANQYGTVVQALQRAGKDLQQKLGKEAGQKPVKESEGGNVGLVGDKPLWW